MNEEKLTGDSQQSTENKNAKRETQNAESINNIALPEMNTEPSNINEETEPNAESIKHNAGKLTTCTIPLTTQNMEVHHHPKAEKKNLKEYFLEFVMIFIAVTLGFLQRAFVNTLAIRLRKKNMLNRWYKTLKLTSRL